MSNVFLNRELYDSRSLRVDDKPNCFCQLEIVFTSNIVTVTGPTPPGTGVYANTFGMTSSNNTSPHHLVLLLSEVVNLCIPTSIITAPSLTKLESMRLGFPAAAINISASLHILFKFKVFE